jgi:ABC-type phosphate/phosphonate transport system substrate-binding protein
MPRTGIAALPPADNSAPKSDTPKSDTMAAKTADLPPAASVSANPGIRTIQEQVAAATALAERVSPNDTDHLIALVMARAEIKSVSDLANKDIAIEDGQSASSASLRTAIAAAGATDAQLSESRTRAIDRLVDGEVPAAVLALVSPEAAEWFPEIKGFRIFRIPLSPGSSKARL